MLMHLQSFNIQLVLMLQVVEQGKFILLSKTLLQRNLRYRKVQKLKMGKFVAMSSIHQKTWWESNSFSFNFHKLIWLTFGFTKSMEIVLWTQTVNLLRKKLVIYQSCKLELANHFMLQAGQIPNTKEVSRLKHGLITIILSAWTQQQYQMSLNKNPQKPTQILKSQRRIISILEKQIR